MLHDSDETSLWRLLRLLKEDINCWEKFTAIIAPTRCDDKYCITKFFWSQKFTYDGNCSKLKRTALTIVIIQFWI